MKPIAWINLITWLSVIIALLLVAQSLTRPEVCFFPKRPSEYISGNLKLQPLPSPERLKAANNAVIMQKLKPSYEEIEQERMDEAMLFPKSYWGKKIRANHKAFVSKKIEVYSDPKSLPKEVPIE